MERPEIACGPWWTRRRGRCRSAVCAVAALAWRRRRWADGLGDRVHQRGAASRHPSARRDQRWPVVWRSFPLRLVSCACQSRGGSWGGETAPGASRWCQHTVGRLSAHSAARPGDVWSPLTVWSVAFDAGARREAQTGHGGRSASNSIGNRCGAASYIICRSLLAMKSVPRRYSPNPFTARAPFTRQRSGDLSCAREKSLYLGRDIQLL